MTILHDTEIKQTSGILRKISKLMFKGSKKNMILLFCPWNKGHPITEGEYEKWQMGVFWIEELIITDNYWPEDHPDIEWNTYRKIKVFGDPHFLKQSISPS